MMNGSRREGLLFCRLKSDKPVIVIVGGSQGSEKVNDLIISRAGATTIFEILALKKLNILIPLSKRVSRGDQEINALSFEASGYSKVISEEDEIDLIEVIRAVLLNKDIYFEKMNVDSPNSTANVIKEIEQSIR